MTMNLNPFRGPSLAVLEQQLRELEADTKPLKDAAEDAELNLAGNPNDSKLNEALAEAEDKLSAHNDQKAKLTRQISAARRRQGAAEKERIKRERVAAGVTAIKHAQASHAPAAKLEQALALVVESWTELAAKRMAMQEASPIELVDYEDLNGFLWKPESLGTAVMLEMRRAGLDFVLRNYPEPVHTMPTLCERLRKVDTILEQRLAEDAAANAPTNGLAASDAA
jgi:hypothetical protein